MKSGFVLRVNRAIEPKDLCPRHGFPAAHWRSVEHRVNKPVTNNTNRTPPEMVCVTLQRPPHFWRFACDLNRTGDLLERLAHLADNEDSDLTWDDAETIASQVLAHRPSNGGKDTPKYDR